MWKTRGGTHIGNRGVGIWGNYLFFVTPDDYLISLDVATGKERWSNEIASFQQQYFLTSAPTVVDNHVIVGTGNDLDVPGFLMSFDPETGKDSGGLHDADERGRSRARHLEEPRGGTAWRRPSLGARDPTIRRRGSTSSARATRRRPTRRRRAVKGRQSLYVRACRHQRGYRQDRVALPDLAARHARLGLGADAGARRRRDQRPAAEAGGDRRAQRLLLHDRPRHRRAHRHQQILGQRELGDRAEREGAAGARSGQGSSHRRRARLGGKRRRRELAAAGIQPATPACSTCHDRDLRDVLLVGNRSAGRDGTRRQGRASGRDGGQLSRRDRLQDGQDGVAAQVPRR